VVVWQIVIACTRVFAEPAQTFGIRDGHGRAPPRGVPAIARFFGIVVTMYHLEHGTPHFHAVYGEYDVSIDIETGVIRGYLPPRVARLVLEWSAAHKAELIANWQLAREGKPLERVDPLE
jgi:hypothetical protein